MVAPSDNHKFNDDLLLHEEDRKLALTKYPSIFHVLDHAELRHFFSKYDVPANRAKHTGLMAGILAIGFGFGALGIAALELLYTQNTTYGIALAIISGLCGVLSFLIGSVGLLFAGRKRNRLRYRLIGEKVRQFHFQMLVFHLPEILASLKDDAAKTLFLSERKLWFETFRAQLVGKLDSAFTAIIQEDESIKPWLFGDAAKRKTAAEIQENRDLDPVFDAYRELRIVHQLDYTSYKLQDDHRVISAMPRRQVAGDFAVYFCLDPFACRYARWRSGRRAISRLNLRRVSPKPSHCFHHLAGARRVSHTRHRTRSTARTRDRTLSAIPFWCQSHSRTL